jgi:hypothetical protein
MDLTKFFPTSSASKPQTSVEHRFDVPSFVTARDNADPDFEEGSVDTAKRVPDGHNEEQGKRKMPRKHKRKRRIIEIASIHAKAPAAQDPPPPSQAANLHPAPIQHSEIPSAKKSAAPASPSSLLASGPSSASVQFPIAAKPTSATTCPPSPFAMASAKVTVTSLSARATEPDRSKWPYRGDQLPFQQVLS